jgi:hypothetical protein
MKSTHRAAPRRVFYADEAQKKLLATGGYWVAVDALDRTEAEAVEEAARSSTPLAWEEHHCERRTFTYAFRLVATILLGRTNGAGEVDVIVTDVARALDSDRRNVQIALRALRDAGWIGVANRASSHTTYQWSEGGTLRPSDSLTSCWGAPRPIAVVQPLAALQHRKPSFDGEVDADPISAAITALEAARKATPLVRRGALNKGRISRINPEHRVIVAEHAWDLVVELGVELREAARRMILAWLHVSGTIDPRAPEGFNVEKGWNLFHFHNDVGEVHAMVTASELRRRARASRPVVEQIAAAVPDVEACREIADEAMRSLQENLASGQPRKRAAGAGS